MTYERNILEIEVSQIKISSDLDIAHYLKFYIETHIVLHFDGFTHILHLWWFYAST